MLNSFNFMLFFLFYVGLTLCTTATTPLYLLSLYLSTIHKAGLRWDGGSNLRRGTVFLCVEKRIIVHEQGGGLSAACNDTQVKYNLI
jgi:hypothetical protein